MSSMSYQDLIVLPTTRVGDIDPVLKPLLTIILLFREESADPCSGPEED